MADNVMRTLLLVGAGKMGSALLRGWLEQAVVPAEQIAILEPAVAADLAELVAAHGLDLNPPIASLVGGDLSAVVIAVKPQVMGDVLPDLQPLMSPKTIFLSIAAGTTIDTIAQHLGREALIARAMPNTPASIGRGITGLFVPSTLKPDQLAYCRRLLAAVGDVVLIDSESLIDVVTAVSGSGPAYVFLLIECLAAAGMDAGLPEDVAKELAIATIAGAGELARLSDDSVTQLRRNVTSPGGTTEAALDILMADGELARLMNRAVRAAIERAKELNA
ncbi:MAG: pyrroline-5-carboxylate reductase [Alphaproteobacteria bacterium]|nr:MAG: pyrroline-5-carboxylate reductase [Alphaproteobacteria bacterium]